jgi:hypothetical protein
MPPVQLFAPLLDILWEVVTLVGLAVSGLLARARFFRTTRSCHQPQEPMQEETEVREDGLEVDHDCEIVVKCCNC